MPAWDMAARATDYETWLVRGLLTAGEFGRTDTAAVVTGVHPSDLLSPVYRAVYAAIAALTEREQVPAPAAVAARMSRDGTLLAIPWVDAALAPTEQMESARAWLAAEADCLPSPAGIGTFAAEVLRLGRLRSLVSVFGAAQLTAVNPDSDPDALTQEVQQRLAVLAPALHLRARTLEEIVVDDAARFGAWLEHPNKLRGYEVGMPTTDFVLNGLEPGRVILLAAGTSHGKSLTALRFARGLAERGQPVLYLTLEMTPEQAKDRLVFARAGIPQTQIRRQRSVSEAQERALMEAVGWVSDLPITLDAGDPDWYAIRARVEAAAGGGRVAAVILDHLDLVSHRKQEGQNRHSQIAAIMSGIKAAAIRHGVPFVVATQVNRERAKREDTIPTLFDLRESGSKEEGADQVLILHRPAQALVNANKPPPPGDDLWHDMRCFVAKNRDGETPVLSWYVDITTQRLEEMADNLAW